MKVIPAEELDSFSENELVLRAQGGDSDVELKLLSRYMAMVRGRAAHYAPPGESEDFFQEGMFALCSAIGNYDFSSSSFSTFARLCVDRRLISVLRRRSRKKVIPKEKRVELSDSVSGVSSDGPEEQLISREDFTRFMEQVKRDLSPLEYAVLDAYLSCGSIAKTAQLLGCGIKAVNNALFRIRTKLKKY